MTYNAEPVLGQLKDFQRATVERVFGRMYDPEDPALRFLVADEVGLGKTLVARGLIAKTIAHLEDKVDRVDVIYVCSNAQIAKQNVQRLQVPGVEHMELADRITMLPIVAHKLSRNKVNLVAFTPGTSFGVAKGSGHKNERAVLRLMLEAVWGSEKFSAKASYRVFQGTVQQLSNFEALCRETRKLYRHHLDEELVNAFESGIAKHDQIGSATGKPPLVSRYEDLCGIFAHDKPQTGFSNQERRLRNAFVGDIRAVLARSCLESLEPDLIILDEFQRFKNLLSDPEIEDVANDVELAHELFEFVDHTSGHNARVLLLSATPYKMMTTTGEVDDDHHRDLVDTFAFLVSHDPCAVSQLRMELKDLRRSLLQIGRDHGEAARAARVRVEASMRRVMVRTERLAATEDRSGMLRTELASVTLEADDVRRFVAVAQLARRLDVSDPLEYWKSAPYLLNYMEEYELGRHLEKSIDSGDITSLAQIDAAGLLPLDKIRRFRPIEFDNARLRWLINDTVGKGAWKLLWMPPSLPYTQPTGPFAEPELQGFTKRLVFSSWRMVPRSVATLTSYEAERRMVSARRKPPYENSAEGRRGRGSRLAFAFTAKRLTGMPILGLLYPSKVLAELGDPLALAAYAGGRPVAVDDAISHVAGTIRQRLVDLSLAIEESGAAISSEGAADETWYWAAPMWLDYEADSGRSQDLFSSARRLASAFTGDHGSPGERFIDHVQRAREATLRSYPNLGPMPTDLAEVLARMALVGPGPVSLRVLARVSRRKLSDSHLAFAACRIAWSIRSLFNGPEATELVRALYEGDPYWQRVLDYSLAGNLQSVLDEYAAVLVPSLGLLECSEDEAIDDLSRAMATSINLRTVNYAVSTFEAKKNRVKVGTERLRANFALRLGDEKAEDGTLSRATDVRDAFNSPFWPFVLVTTSAGQEGLDFHQFCHAVVHWNLPANPVDLEQREGRVHRFMGHAIRRNVAVEYRHLGLTAPDPWRAMLDAAKDDRPAGSTDIIPYWVYTGSGEDPARIERYVPALPLSKDRSRADALQKSVALYRLAFGQPRQEDLIAYLGTQIDPVELKSIIDDIRIDLSP